MPRGKKITAVPVDELDEVFETAELAERLHLSARTIEGWRTRGSGPRFVKMGKRVLYRKSAVVRWLDERTQSHTGEAP